MSSSSSSDYSDEDLETMRPITVAPTAPNLDQVVELAQICSFCTTFRQPLRLPSFSRTDLQEAILSAPNGDTTHVELLAELHFKLAREHPSAKMEKMVQDWEKTLARKLQDNWRKEFTANPMAGGVAYGDLVVSERVKILDALCHWKLDTCADIQKHIATLQKENDIEAIDRLRAGEIGTDDNGVSYWYFHDACWVYAEDKLQWQLENREQSYMVEFASTKRIRLSINFDPDYTSPSPTLGLPVEVATDGKGVMKETTMQIPSELKFNHGEKISGTDKIEPGQAAAEVVWAEKKEPEHGHVPTDVGVISLKEGSSPALKTLSDKSMDTCMPQSLKAVSTQSNSLEDFDRNGNFIKAEAMASFASVTVAYGSQAEENARCCDKSNKKSLGLHVRIDATRSSKMEGPGKAFDSLLDQTQSCVVAVVGSKKRTIVDDDSSGGSSSEAETLVRLTGAKLDMQAVASTQLQKKRKTSFGAKGPTQIPCAEIYKDQLDTHANKSSYVQAESDASVAEDHTAPIMANSVSTVNERLPAKMVDYSSLLTAEKEEINMACNVIKNGSTEIKKIKDAAREVKLLSSTLKSPTDPDAAPELFDITCESCKKCYDMRYVDPPLVERPTEEWRCFECLVNDARGWPRRRKSALRETYSPRRNDLTSRKRDLSSKSRSGSSSWKSPAKSSSKRPSSFSNSKSSSHSKISKRKSSNSKSGSSKKSSSKKHKKRKSSSSSHHHHSSHGHRRRHHSHYHHAEFARLVALFQERQEQRLTIEKSRICGDLEMTYDDGPKGWRVVSSTLDELQALIESLSGGSLEQNRLRGRLILILKDQEKSDEQRRKQQELAWNILPRRQSSRIAIGRMKNQSANESDADDNCSENDRESRRLRLRSRKLHSATSDCDDEKHKHDRAWRARRRHNGLDHDEEDEDDGTMAEDWVDWSLVKCNPHSLSTVCLALVNRLLKEEAADLFSRPVNPELDGCPDYLSVITHPMDLGTIRSRVESNYYQKWNLFKEEVELVWRNCRTFNAPDTLVVQFANELSKLSRSMYIAAEKKGVNFLKDKTCRDLNDSDNHLSDVSKAESQSSINKAWSESSASENSDSSDGNSSSASDSDSNTRRRERVNSRTSCEKPLTRPRLNRPRISVDQGSRCRSSRKRPVPPSINQRGELIASATEVLSPVRKCRQPVQKPFLKRNDQVEPAFNDEGSSGGDCTKNQNGNLLLSPTRLPPPHVAQKRPTHRLIISDSSNSDDSSDSGNSSTSSSSDSDDSDSDARSLNKHPQPPSPSAAVVPTPTPPPPTPPPPATSPIKRRSSAQATLDQRLDTNTGASQDGETTEPFQLRPDALPACTRSPAFLNPYLSSSSSSDLSSSDSDSSDGDSEVD
ncbi:Transcription initiation factor TFIID, subunit BDF1 and related bromodomain proteins [Plasmopara halstedii]|uniref:Transcription initiation factor TFIID, subunit BDF1 and related bromodomain proteins n=1 Tax=Plasmopara halstedii TaxID=4781 RepID=A0A0P1AAA4_PLAHL|nr:Transcription initiation factor TFIID, subunit BDF1 and related bromodomain proteins [Plasmopara halstedii]CEG37071.1 Transcription initiation factor TFIID, subunit BDF1 and related bromodomain proteins [Plasmopara halstedii]|eukprot:XP_024573440.1 Transcription initiation factor TFIID, subunit BDF1 and related bromodomain proteins [Plasmopara halstedii]